MFTTLTRPSATLSHSRGRGLSRRSWRSPSPRVSGEKVAEGRMRGAYTVLRSTIIECACISTSSPALPLPVLAQVGDRLVRVDHLLPAVAPRTGRQLERHRLVVGVEEQVEAVVDDRLAAVVGRRDAPCRSGTRRACGANPLCQSSSVISLAVRLEPADVADVRCRGPGGPWNQRRRRKTGCSLAELDHAARRTRSSPSSDVLPVEPGDLVVLAVGVVVAAAACGRSRRRRAASARPARGTASSGSCAAAARAAR